MKRKEILLLAACFLVWVGSVYAQPQPGSPWPMIHHDQYHTGRSQYNGPETLTLKWSFATVDTENGIGNSPAIAADGTIYIMSGGYLYAVNPDGTEKWRVLIGGGESSPAIGEGGTIYIGDYAPFFYALNPTGTEKWRYDMGGAYTWCSPTIGPDGRIYVGNMGAPSTFYSLNPDGTEEWAYTGPSHFNEAPSIGPDGTIYIRSDDGYLYAFSTTGSVLWKYYIRPSGGGYRASTSFSVADSTVYTGSPDGSLYALSPDGDLKWTFPTGGWITCAPAIGEDGTIYFGSYDSTLYALYADGILKWSFPVVGKVFSSAAIDSDGTIYFVTWDFDTSGNRVYALNPGGTLLWSYGLPGGNSSSPAIGSDGTLYIGCRDGNLYAFGTPTGVERKDRFQVFRYQLLQNRPNPFMASSKGTVIRYGIAQAGKVSLKVYDVSGRLVKTLVKGKKKAGFYSVPWNGKDTRGKKLASGIYFYRVETGTFTATKKLILLR